MIPTYTIPLDSTLPKTDRGYNYGEGSNQELRHKLWQRARDREEKRRKNGR